MFINNFASTIFKIFLCLIWMLSVGCFIGQSTISISVENAGKHAIDEVRIQDKKFGFMFGYFLPGKSAQYCCLRTNLPRTFSIRWRDDKSRSHEEKIVFEKPRGWRFKGIFMIMIDDNNSVSVERYSDEEYYKEAREAIRSMKK